MGLFHTEVSGPALRIEVGECTVFKLAVGPMDNNAYLISDGQVAILIDAADQADRLIDLVASHNLVTIITTHAHSDHVQALAALHRVHPVPVLAGAPDCAEITNQTGVAPLPVWTGERITEGQINLEVIGLVGHTPGSIALVLSQDAGPCHIFTGDSLFPGGVGNTANRADFDRLFTDVTTQIFDRFDDQTVIHPGHGDSTTLGDERPHLAEWQERGW